MRIWIKKNEKEKEIKYLFTLCRNPSDNCNSPL
jgi:hypothetical protein